jgi:hypothetical protein
MFSYLELAELAGHHLIILWGHIVPGKITSASGNYICLTTQKSLDHQPGSQSFESFKTVL